MVALLTREYALAWNWSHPTGFSLRTKYWSAHPQQQSRRRGITPDPVASNLFALTKVYPLPQINSLVGNNIFYNSGNDLNNNQGDLKVDFVPSQKDRIFGRWSQMDLNQPTFTGCVACNSGATEGSDEPVKNAAIDWTHTLSRTC